jgi:RNA polymerase sigma-70 factor (ECF subfamily)
VSTRTDAELVQATLAGERDSYGELIGRYERAVFALAGSKSIEWHAIRDIAQETFILGYQKLRSLRDPSLFGSWILSICRNQVAKDIRSRKPALQLSTDMEARGEEDRNMLSDETQLVLSAVMELPEPQRVAVLLRYFGGYSVDEIATQTHQPAGTVGSHLSRAREALRTLMKGCDA